MNISKGLRNNLTEMIALCDEQISRWKLTREQLAMLSENGGNGHVQKMITMTEVAMDAHKAKRKHRPYTPDKPHWTQTPAGKRKMAAAMHRMYAKKRAAEKAAKSQHATT